MDLRACIFDLDGVIVDTAGYHYLAWRKLAQEELGFNFKEEDNEKLKGVSRKRSLEILLELAHLNMETEKREELMALKNRWYLQYITKMTPNEILPGTTGFLSDLRNEKYKIGLGSASKNAPLILAKIGLQDMFDTVVDGNKVQKAKPDPEVFLKAASDLKTEPEHCVVFEDAQSGIEAAKNAGMFCIGIGSAEILKGADMVIKGLYEMNFQKFKSL